MCGARRKPTQRADSLQGQSCACPQGQARTLACGHRGQQHCSACADAPGSVCMHQVWALQVARGMFEAAHSFGGAGMHARSCLVGVVGAGWPARCASYNTGLAQLMLH